MLLLLLLLLHGSRMKRIPRAERDRVNLSGHEKRIRIRQKVEPWRFDGVTSATLKARRARGSFHLTSLSS